MRKRPLSMICLFFLIGNALILMTTGGKSFLEAPVSFVFSAIENDSSILIQGQIYKKTSTSKTQILYLKENSILYQNKSFYESNILVYDNTFQEIPIGKTILLRGQLNQFECARNPGNFDQRVYYAKQNIYGYVWCEEILSSNGSEDKILEKLYQWKMIWKKTLQQNMNERTSGVLSAILLSEKSEMDAQVKELYQKNGIGHVLAISGLHISFIGLGIYRWLRKCNLPYAISGGIAVLVLTGYVLMIGFLVSAIRAYIMLLLRIGADILGRAYDMLTGVMLSAAVIVLWQPLYLMDAGFYLSHGAILGIIFVMPVLEKVIPFKNIILKKSIASIGINLALFPILLWFYYEIPTYSIALNMLVIPFMSLVLGFGLVGSVFGLIWAPLGKLCFVVCNCILRFYESLGEIGSRLPFYRIVFGKPNWWEMMIYYVVLIIFLVYIKYFTGEEVGKRMKLFWGAIGITLLLMFIKVPNGKLQVTMLDVGQGDCMFLKGPSGDTYFIDGGSSDIQNVGKYRIEPFLKSQGVGKIDYVFLSHGDADHYNGIVELMERQKFGVKIRNLVFPSQYQMDEELVEIATLALSNGINVFTMDAGQKIIERDMEILCIQPLKEETYLEKNAGSMVLEISMGNFEMLCTGDVEQEGEERLRRHINGRNYDILKVAHHGSKNSTTESFLEIVNPKVALISAGIQNRYGHPHEEVISRLEKYDVKIYQTPKCGAIGFETDGDSIDFCFTSI